jgi:hypothetical protein
MEKLANLTQTDINNGVLIRMLANAGIPDVQEYVKTFHQETEDLIVEEFEHSDRNKADNDEQIVPPADIQSWIAGLRLRLDDPIKAPAPEQLQQQQLPQDIHGLVKNLRPIINNTGHINSAEQQPKQQQQQLPTDVQGWITGLGPRLDDPIQPSLGEQQQQQQQLPTDVQGWITGLRPRLDDPIQPSSGEQQQQKQLPTDLTTWMHRITPINLPSSTDAAKTETTTTSNDDTAVTGNLGTWLNDWSKSLAEQPPPTSLDNWLQSLIPTNMNEPIGKATNPKSRLNTYLNAAQEVFSQHGYNVSNEVTPPTSIETKTGMFGNVKQMYFLVSCHLLSSKLIIYICSVLFHPVENLR